MPRLTRLLLPLLCACALAACKKESPKAAAPDAATGRSTPGKPGKGLDIPPPEDVAAIPADAQKSASGLAWKVLQAPQKADEHPEEQDKVQINFTGWTTDGKAFTSSRGKPALVPVKRFPGWTEALELMAPGEKRRIWIPESLAYQGKKGAPAGMLVFEIELLSITRGPKPLPPPEDVAAIPATATVTKSGLAYRVLKPGTGKDKPKAQSYVQVNYTGWTTDGKMFDSSVTRNRPAAFPLTGVVAGWTEGLQLMTVGEQVRLWVPENLAYAGKPGFPAGMLVFDVELVDFVTIETPPDIAKTPADAQKSPSGLAWKVLKKGTAGPSPTRTSQVKVNYTMWDKDGKLFDSSVGRFQPTQSVIANLPAGWAEALTTMVPGEKRRLWLTEELARRGTRTVGPPGPRTCDVELIEILPDRPITPPAGKVVPGAPGVPGVAPITPGAVPPKPIKPGPTG
jgi:FKBP-type peptidyl-prolyl cis-trans isomerase